MRSKESWKEFQLLTAPKMAIVARMGTDSGQMMRTKTVSVPAPSSAALSSMSAGMDSMYVLTRMMLKGTTKLGSM